MRRCSTRIEFPIFNFGLLEPCTPAPCHGPESHPEAPPTGARERSLHNEPWWRSVKDGSDRRWIATQYEQQETPTTDPATRP